MNSMPGNTTPAPRTQQIRWWRLARKELRETLRDRRTIVTLVLMPLLVYPLLSLGLQQFLFSSASSLSKIRWHVGSADEQLVEDLQRWVVEGDKALRTKSEAESDNTTTPSVDPTARKVTDIQWFVAPDPKQLQSSLEALDMDLIVARDPGDPAKIILKYRSETPLSSQLASFIEERLEAANLADLKSRLRAVASPTNDKISYEFTAIESQAKSGVQLASIVPLILILMTITGAVYPAIDLTAGERERGTLESLMAAPVPRFRLLAAKYVAVVTVAMLTAAVNLLAMTVTLTSTGLATALVGEGGITLSLVVQLLALLLLFAAFFSALLLTLTSFARSFKEAQAYLIPLMLISLGPGFVSLMPGMRLEGILTVTPLANMVLLARDVLAGTAEPFGATVAVFSTVLYAIAALALAARIFGSDAILYGSSGSWSDLFAKPLTPRTSPTIVAAAMSVAIVYPCYFLGNGVVALFRESSMPVQLLASSLITIAVFAMVPLLLAVVSSVQLRSGFQIHRVAPLVWVAAILLGISLWPLASQLMLEVRNRGFSSISDDQLKMLADKLTGALDAWRKLPAMAIVLAIAVVPGICEEWFFRGYLLGACRHRLSAPLAIGATSLAFGLFHLSVGGVVAVDRVLSSMLLGVVLGCVAWRSGSVLPGMLIHVMHNGIVVLMGYYKTELVAAQWLPDSQAETLPTIWLVVAATVAMLGGVLLWLSTRRNTPSLPASSTTAAVSET